MARDEFPEIPPLPLQPLPLPAGADVSVRRAMPEDWPAIAELLLFFGLPTDRVCARLSQYMVARIDTSFAGAASWCMSGGQFRICLVAVVPEWQHQNVGTALLSSLEDLALSRGITLPTVDLDDSSPFFADYSAEEEASRCDCRG